MKPENIKFKAKRLDGKGWVCGYFYEENGNTYIIENRQKESKLNRNLSYQVDPSRRECLHQLHYDFGAVFL